MDKLEVENIHAQTELKHDFDLVAPKSTSNHDGTSHQ